MTPTEHLQSLTEFFERCGANARRQFKDGRGPYYDGQADALFFAAVHLRAALSELQKEQDHERI